MEKKYVSELEISSTAFNDEENIPSVYSCEGEAINPPLQINKIPEGTKSLAIIMEDPDAPNGTFNHWLAWNIAPTNIIEENSNIGISGKNSGNKIGYYPPCPPSGSHRYYFYVFALNQMLDVEEGADRETLLKTMEPFIMAQGMLMGRYQKKAETAEASA